MSILKNQQEAAGVLAADLLDARGLIIGQRETPEGPYTSVRIDFSDERGVPGVLHDFRHAGVRRVDFSYGEHPTHRGVQTLLLENPSEKYVASHSYNGAEGDITDILPYLYVNEFSKRDNAEGPRLRAAREIVHILSTENAAMGTSALPAGDTLNHSSSTVEGLSLESAGKTQDSLVRAIVDNVFKQAGF